ncbi:HNH endonuclease [Bifidobacterium leontopitheci]|uniref:HNH endonuclease n=2 Tax=Bifidobacterium leontopitheci TaxID=2650774 RepID=A0A6I1GJF2_9BIFI|nr:HNH endonuclease [Bifidobacterium leontopitheci]
MSGVSRRARRMVRRCSKRLNALDDTLQRLGYPIIESDSLTRSFEEWHVRAELAQSFIKDEERRREDISIAVRHIARHRGWRNPYHRVESLIADNPYSTQYQELKSRAESRLGRNVSDGLTPAQLVCAVLSAGYDEAPRLRSSNKHGEGLLPQRLMQEDNANELKRIFTVQRIPREEWEPLFRKVFYAVSPKGSAERHVGCDPFDASQPRALKASLVFQRYRIANVLTNLRIRENGQERSLTITEKNQAFALLASNAQDELTWADVAQELGYSRNQLRGVGKATEDGEDRITSTPPRLTSIQRIAGADKKIAKPLQHWWQNASESSQEAMIRLLSNTVDFDQVRDDIVYADAIEFVDALDDDGLTKLDSVDLPAGRAAYGEETLRKLTERMLTTDDDLHAARTVLFHVSDYWRPPADAIGAPLGNPSVDRVVKIVNQWMQACQNRWGNPVSVQIEHVRSAFDSVATAREYENRTGKRSEYRSNLAKSLKEQEHLDRVRHTDLRRIEAIQRQNSQCLYCGRMITFRDCEMDHIVPRKGVGSTNTRANLAAVCADCNRMKSNTPFAVWAHSEAAQERGVSLKDALQRVTHMQRDPKADTPQTWRSFQQEVKMRLGQTESDEPIDNRSIESVAWMANELHRRIDWHFNSARYLAQSENEWAKTVVSVQVFPGKVTASARRASGLEGRIHFFGAHYKTRLDRRHHAVDASVIAMMRPSVAKTLMERESLRESQQISDAWRILGEREWKEYPYAGCEGYELYQQWRTSMELLLELLNDALDDDRVVVRQPIRLKLGNSIAHDATVRSLQKVVLGSAMDADLIRRASSPALWCALTRLPDYDEKTGLPENRERQITVHGTTYRAEDEIGFFASQAAQIAVRGGSADIGSAIHHARVYRCWKTGAKGARKYWYGMIRVFQADLLRNSGEDLFSVKLPPQSVSMRWGEPRTVHAILAGNAEYLGWLVAGDELLVDFSRGKINGKNAKFVNWCNETGATEAIYESWTLAGFDTNSKLKLRPTVLAKEGLSNVPEHVKVPVEVGGILGDSGWRPSVDMTGTYMPIVIRRNALGELRWKSKAGLPCSWRWAR